LPTRIIRSPTTEASPRLKPVNGALGINATIGPTVPPLVSVRA
jgi:hypothetical protein